MPKEIEEYAADLTSPVSSLLKRLEKETAEKRPLPQMLSDKVEDRFLQIRIRIPGTRRAVEIGPSSVIPPS